MSKEQRYILDYVTISEKRGIITYNNYLTGETVKNKNMFFYSEELNVNQVSETDWRFDYLTPVSIGDEIEISHICDLHGWLREEPDNFFSYIVSQRLFEILNHFNLYPNKFYDAKVLFNEDIYQYFVWQLFMDGFDTFIDFDCTTFCEYEFDENQKIGNELVNVKNLRELRRVRREKGWEDWGFDRLVMKPGFKEMDCVWIDPLGIVISERLKNALEAVQPPLTGLEILPCPVQFEYL